MKKIHVSLDESTMNKIEDFKALNNCSYSKAIMNLIDMAHEQKAFIEKIEKLYKSLNIIQNKESLIIDLLKQLYSDLEIENLTNPQLSTALQEFFKKRRMSEDD